MNTKKLIVIFLMIALIIGIYPIVILAEESETVDEALNFNVELFTESTSVKAGDTLSVVAKISEINKNSARGILVLHGILTYDENYLELEDIKGIDDWKISMEDYNPANGKFIAVADKFIDKAGDICEIVFKVKEDVEEAQAKVSITEIEGATAEYKHGIVESKNETSEVVIAVEKEEEKPTYILGDVDCDGTITANDLAKMKLHDIGIKSLEGIELEIADVDKDGDVDINDIARLKLYLIGTIKEL